MESWVLGSAPTLRSPYDDLDLGRRLVLEPQHVAVAVLLRAATLLVEVLPTHVHGEKPLAKSLRRDEGWPEVHELLLAIAFRCAIEGSLYLLACGDRDAALVRQHQGRKGVAAGDDLQISCGQSLPVADEEASQVFICGVHHRFSSCSIAQTYLTATLRWTHPLSPIQQRRRRSVLRGSARMGRRLRHGPVFVTLPKIHASLD